MRVGYVSSADPKQPWAWSGTHRFMFAALQRAGLEVEHVGRSFIGRETRLKRAIKRVRQRLGGFQPMQQDELDADIWRASFERDVRESASQVLFAPVASQEIALVNTSLPYVYLSDATSLALRATDPDYARQTAEALERLQRAETSAMALAATLIYPSRWAAESAVADYGVARDRIRVIEFGANLSNPPDRRQALDRQRGDVCHLLFVGRRWDKKGGPVAVDTVVELNRRGIDAELTICGVDVPAAYRHPRVVAMGCLDKSVPAENAKLVEAFRKAHFFVLPSRFECFGIAYCEANAYGLPILGSSTGGVPTIIEEGKNGCLLPYEAPGAAYADAIASIWESDERYRSLVVSARDAFELRLNWDAWGARVKNELLSAGGQHFRSAHEKGGP